MLISCFIWKLDIFPLMCAADKVWITELTLIHKHMRSVRNSHAQVFRSIWRKAHYEVPDKAITSVLMASIDIVRNILVRLIGLAEILAIMSISTFKIAVILYVSIIL
jgi:hypothetical protein